MLAVKMLRADTEDYSSSSFYVFFISLIWRQKKFCWKPKKPVWQWLVCLLVKWFITHAHL